MSISEDGSEFSYITTDDWGTPYNCVAKRFSLKTMSNLSSDNVGSPACTFQSGGAARARHPIVASHWGCGWQPDLLSV